MSDQILIITGMHRSGTSLTAHYLSECGLHIGNNLINSDKSNPLSAYDGHHEDREFRNFQKNILDKKRIYSFPTNDFRIPVQVGRDDREIALKLIKSRENISQWAWKDPRTSLFLDFWFDTIKNTKYLFLLRNPLAVVDSLIRRGTDQKILHKPIIGLRAWKVYNRQILKFWNKHQDISLICEIDELIRAPDSISHYLTERFNFKLKNITFDHIFSKRAFHSKHSDLVEIIKNQYPKEVAKSMELYQELGKISVNKN